NTYDMRYDETRTVWRVLYVHDGPARGVVFAGSNHGVTRIDGAGYRDHIHAACLNSQGIYMMGNWRGLVLDADANLWLAGAYMVGRFRWVADPLRWLDGDGNTFINAFRPIYPNQPCDRTLTESHLGAAVTSDGRVWFASSGHGLAMWDPTTGVAVLGTA